MSYRLSLLARVARAMTLNTRQRYVGQVELADAYAFAGPYLPGTGAVVYTDYLYTTPDGTDVFGAVGYVLWE